MTPRVGRADRGQRGAVALEAVLAAPLVALLATGVLGLTVVVSDQLVAERVARSAARAVAVTGTVGDAAAGLPADGRLDVVRAGRAVTVEVTVTGAVVGLPYTVRALSTATLEPALP